MIVYKKKKKKIMTELNFMDSCVSSGPSKKCGVMKKNDAQRLMLFEPLRFI